MAWVTNMIITTIYYLLSAVTFYKLLNASQQVSLASPPSPAPSAAPAPSPSSGTPQSFDIEHVLTLDRIWRAPLASCLLGSLLVFGFNIFSCCILIKYVLGPVALPPGCVPQATHRRRSCTRSSVSRNQPSAPLCPQEINQSQRAWIWLRLLGCLLLHTRVLLSPRCLGHGQLFGNDP